MSRAPGQGTSAPATSYSCCRLRVAAPAGRSCTSGCIAAGSSRLRSASHGRVLNKHCSSGAQPWCGLARCIGCSAVPSVVSPEQATSHAHERPCAEPCPSDQTHGKEGPPADTGSDADSCSVQRADATELSSTSFDLGFSRGAHPEPGKNVVLRIEAETEHETRVRYTLLERNSFISLVARSLVRSGSV